MYSLLRIPFQVLSYQDNAEIRDIIVDRDDYLNNLYDGICSTISDASDEDEEYSPSECRFYKVSFLACEM